MIELVKISENISRSFNGKETVETLQAVNYRIVENGVENRKFSVEKRWKARIFKEIPRFHRKRQTEKSGREKESVVKSFPYQAAPAERSWRDFRACFASVRTHLACIFSEIFQENTRKSTKDFLRFSFHLSKNLTAQSAYA